MRIKDKLIDILKRVGYYRFSGYLHQFRVDHDNYQAGTNLDDVYKIYCFDRQLRIISFDAIERFEIFIRTNLAYSLSGTYGAFSYWDSNTLPGLNEDNYNKLIAKCRRNYDYSEEPFIDHFKQEIGRQNKKVFPILSILKYSLDITAPNSNWAKRFFNLVDKYKELDLSSIGFPKNWKMNPIWK